LLVHAGERAAPIAGQPDLRRGYIPQGYPWSERPG
jgi:hypothetical protein